MNQFIEKCKLTIEQRQIIVRGIQEGKDKAQEFSNLIGNTTTRKHKSSLEYDVINTEVGNSIKSNPHIGMEVYQRQAGFHPFIVLHDTVRNIFVLVLRLPSNKSIFDPSNYRGEFASSNVNRLIEMGLEPDDMPEGYHHQWSLSLGIEKQPFGIIVCYDATEDKIYEGALRPDQEDWLYKEDITNSTEVGVDNVEYLNRTQLSEEIELQLKEQVVEDEDEDGISLKLKE